MTQSAPDGSFYFLGLPSGDYRLYASACSYWEGDKSDVRVDDQSLSNVNLFLSPK